MVLGDLQFGYRKCRSTIDLLLQLDAYIHNAFAKGLQLGKGLCLRMVITHPRFSHLVCKASSHSFLKVFMTLKTAFHQTVQEDIPQRCS